MNHIRCGLLCWGRTNYTKLNEVHILHNKDLRCIHFKIYNENVSSLKIIKSDIKCRKWMSWVFLCIN